MQYLSYLKKYSALPLASIFLSILVNTLAYALPLPPSLHNKPVNYHHVHQVNGWSCGYNTLYNACSLESSFGKHNPHSELNRFISVCAPRLQQQGMSPQHGASNITIEDLAPRLGLRPWTSLHIQSYGVAPLISAPIHVSYPHGASNEHVQRLIKEAHQRRGQETIARIQQELDRAPLGQPHFAHFMCSVHSARGIPHAVLATVVKHANGNRELHVCDNLNEPIHEHTEIKKHIDYLCHHFGIGSAAVPVHRPVNPSPTPDTKRTPYTRRARQQPQRKARQQPQRKASRNARQPQRQNTRRRQQTPSTMRSAAMRLKLAQARQARNRRAQLQKRMLAARTLKKRMVHRSAQKR
jgi:hypothetical protein